MSIKTNFKIALAAANMTLKAWAQNHQVTYQAVSFVLNGQMKSQRLSIAIESFINQEFQKLSQTDKSTQSTIQNN
jgi:hypothetical protein